MYSILWVNMVRQHMRRYRRYVMLAIECLIAISIFLTVEMVMSRIGLSFDLTPEGRYSLSLRSKEVLAGVDGPLKIKVFVKKEGEQERIRTLLEPFRRENPFVEYELINMDRNPGLARKYNVRSYYTTVLEYKERREITGFPWEEHISGALARLVGKESTAIYFVPRPGEQDFNAERGGEHGFDFARMRLLREGYALKSLKLEEVAKIPEQLQVLAIIGPSSDYSELEIELVRAFIREGGRVLFFLDPEPLPNLEKLLEEYGIKLPRMVVVDREGHPPEWDDWTIVVPFINKQHPIARGVSLPSVFPLCRPVELNISEDEKTTELIATGKTSWVTSSALKVDGRPSFNPASDRKGPITVGITREIVAGNNQVARIVVFGNSRFFDNTYIKLLGNGELFINTIYWISKEDILKTEDTVNYGKALSLSSKEFMKLQMVCVSLPLATILIGCVMVFMRRRQ